MVHGDSHCVGHVLVYVSQSKYMVNRKGMDPLGLIEGCSYGFGVCNLIPHVWVLGPRG